MSICLDGYLVNNNNIVSRREGGGRTSVDVLAEDKTSGGLVLRADVIVDKIASLKVGTYH